MRITLIIMGLLALSSTHAFADSHPQVEREIDIPKDTSQSMKFTFKWNKGFMGSYTKGPAILHLLNREYGSEQIQGSVLQPVDDYINTGMELGVERYYRDGFYAAARFGGRQLNERISGVFQLGSGAKEQCNVTVQQNFMNMGFGLGYDALNMLELKKEVRLIVYAGLDGRFAMNKRVRGYYYTPATSNTVRYEFMTSDYDTDKLYLDPLVGVSFKIAYLTIEGRLQSFHKDLYEPDDKSYPFEIMDRLKLYSLMVGVSF